MISNIISKEFYSIGEDLQILWTPSESVFFTDFISTTFSPCTLIDFDKTYYGNHNISIVICNNRLLYLEKCIELAKFFHSPLLIVDHLPKSEMINNDFVIDLPFEPFYQVATSKDIFLSWSKIQNIVLGYKKDSKTIDSWKKLFMSLIKSHFIIKDDKKHDT